MPAIVPDLLVKVEHGEDRAHPYIADMLVLYAMMLADLARHLQTPPAADANVTLACLAADLDLEFEIGEFIGASLTGEIPDVINIMTNEKGPEPQGEDVLGLKSVLTRVTCAQFSVYAEAACDWVKRNVSSAVHSWPPTINFGRVVRNAIVHGGTINIPSPRSPAVSWRGLTYSHQSFGREIINKGDLSLGDLIVLMLEIEIELNGIGAPYDLR